MNVEKGWFGNCPAADFIVTSAPYANRLDYSRLWAPELELISAMWDGSSAEIKASQIGSTVIRGKNVCKDDEAALPKTILEALDAIRNNKQALSSDSYYYPFFLNYAVSMAQGLRQMAEKLRPGGKIVMFIRDTVRKDVLFPAKDLVHDILVDEAGMSEACKHRKVIKSHVGLVRRSQSISLYGLAQQEWWVTYYKEQ